MKKRASIIVLLLLITVGLLSGVFAATNSSTTNNSTSTSNLDGIEKAYQCIKNIIDEKDSFSLQESVFSTLAIGSNKKLEDSIQNEKGTNCWPKSSCALKETSQVVLAYNRISENTDSIEEWIKSKSDVAKELTWYVEIDIQNQKTAGCSIAYDGSAKKISVKEDMTLAGSAGTCFTISSSGYWLKVKDSCIDKTFEISCDEDFVTTVLYEKGSGGTIYVSSETHSAASSGTTEEKISAKCLRTGTSCDYEGSLWGALALHKTGNNVADYLPYLMALADNNQKYSPNAFLYLLTAADDQYSKIIQSQKQGQYWQMTGTPYNKYYDSALALLALSGSGASELDATKGYFLGIQSKEGCWNNNNLRDSAFLAYAGWVKSVPSSSGGGTVSSNCESSGFYCELPIDCLDAGGSTLNTYTCSSFGDFCCSKQVQEQTCSNRGGIICGASQTCSGQQVPSLEGGCCLGACQETGASNACENLGQGTCRSSCFSDEIAIEESCAEATEVCCEFNSSGEPSEDQKNLWWLWILIILIIIVIIAIIFRNRIKLWWYKRKGTVSSTRVVPGDNAPRGLMGTRPGPRFGPPMQPQPRLMQRPMSSRPQPIQRVQSKVQPRAVSAKDKEMEETLRKLREMSK